jgi:hypothetical protein
MIDNLTDDNFMIYAMKCYNSSHCILSEFESDLKRIKYLKRLFRRFKSSKILKERLILNHIIMLNNVFGAYATSKILFFKVDERDYDALKTFLLYLNILPNEITGLRGNIILTKEIPINDYVAGILLNI